MTYEGVNLQNFLINFLYPNFLETRVSQNILRKNYQNMFSENVRTNYLTKIIVITKETKF